MSKVTYAPGDLVVWTETRLAGRGYPRKHAALVVWHCAVCDTYSCRGYWNGGAPPGHEVVRIRWADTLEEYDARTYELEPLVKSGQ